jgi:hypothetical protein
MKRTKACYFHLIGCLAALVMASEAGAGALCPTFQAPVSYAAGNAPDAVAVADLDGDTVPDLVTTNLLRIQGCRSEFSQIGGRSNDA